MKLNTIGMLIAGVAAASSMQAALFVGPDSNAATSVSPGSAALVFKVTADISITAVSAFADGGSLAGAVSVQIRDYNNNLLGGTTITTGSPIVNSVWATESLGSPITLTPGTYSISGFGSYTFDFGASTHATYAGAGAVSAYDSYYPTGSPSQSVIIGNSGTPSAPAFGAGWTALGDPKMRAVNFDFTVVPEPSTYALVGGLALVGFGLWRRSSSK
ncbi:MAG TPA: PEP-CTERM sorting domain-containing protein [Candidatus Limnocylindria bacterium]|jgi:hypothetical protein|nr:PEP-CTERM sorting domain-containing protein [Candidatus Limnocylindria bacterium]